MKIPLGLMMGLLLYNTIFSQPGDWRKLQLLAGLDPDCKPNTLSDSEKELGWELLFDGMSLQGWRQYRFTTLPAGWMIRDSSIYKLAGGGDIIYAKLYRDFVWSIEWKISVGGNSGLFYRGIETKSDLYWNAIEMQVLDNDNHPNGKTPNRMAGAIYDMYAPNPNGVIGYDATYKRLGKPDGYNKVLVVVHGNQHAMWLNGIPVVSFNFGSEDWNTRKKISKFRDLPDYGRALEGFLGLQDHSNEAWYRNLKIRPLPPEPRQEDIWPHKSTTSFTIFRKIKPRPAANPILNIDIQGRLRSNIHSSINIGRNSVAPLHAFSFD